MAVDPSIPLQTGPSIPQIAQQWMGLSQMSNALQTQRWQMQQAVEDKRKRAAILDLYRRPDAFDANGVISLDAIKQMATIDPEIAGEAAKNRVGMMNQMEMMQKRRTDEMKAKQSVGVNFIKQFSTFHETAKERGMGDQQANEYAKSETMRAMDEAEHAGIEPGFTANDWRGLHMLVGNLNPDRAQAAVRSSLAAKEFEDVESTRRAERRIGEIEQGKAPEQPAPTQGVPLSEMGAQPRMIEGAAGEVVPQSIDPQSGAVVRGFQAPDLSLGGPRPVMVPPESAAPTEPVKAPPAAMSEEQQLRGEIANLQARQKVYRQEGLSKKANEVDVQIEKRRDDIESVRKRIREEEMLPAKMQRLRQQIELKSNTQRELPLDTARFIAEQYVDGNTAAAVGFARNSIAKNQIAEQITAVAKERGMTPRDVNAALGNFRGLMTEETVVGRRAGSIGIAINELKKFVPLAQQASAAVPRTEFRPYNELQRMWQEKVFMSPAQRTLHNQTQAVLNANAQIIARGGQNVHSMLLAEKTLTSADSPATYDAALRAMWAEAQGAMQAVEGAREDIRRQVKGEQPYREPYPETKASPKRMDTRGQTPRVNSIEEAMKLPKGTRFVDPNGVERVR